MFQKLPDQFQEFIGGGAAFECQGHAAFFGEGGVADLIAPGAPPQGDEDARGAGCGQFPDGAGSGAGDNQAGGGHEVGEFFAEER